MYYIKALAQYSLLTFFQFMVALKALSNIGRTSETFHSKLQVFIEDFHLDSDVRLAAVDVYRRLPCDSSRPYFQKIFLNSNEDVELRIASYLQIMRCPDYLLIRTIRQSLINEEVNQGKFSIKVNFFNFVNNFQYALTKNNLKKNNKNRFAVFLNF